MACFQLTPKKLYVLSWKSASRSSYPRAQRPRWANAVHHCIAWLIVVSNTAVADGSIGSQAFQFDIPSQPAESALTEFAEQADLTLVFPDEMVRNRTANALVGKYSLEEGAAILLAGTGLIPSFSNPIVLSITIDETSKSGEKAVNATKKAGLIAIVAGILSGGVDAQETEAPGDAEAPGDTGEILRIPEILVVGRPLNMDIRRSENDAQPYVVFDVEEISRSGAINVEEFLRDRLPSNANLGARRQGGTDNVSVVDLRGLGSDETLILVNGRRVPSVTRAGSSGTSFTQSDINGIPISSIERIEVLASTASGIYGGGATGGVVNIILRSDYSGVELGVNYDNAFDTDSAILRLDGSLGFSLEGGRTSIFLTTSYQEANDLLAQDRDFAREARALALRNNPEGFFGGFTPLAGFTGNVQGFGPLILRDGTELGSNITFIPEGYAGPASDGGAALVANAGQFNLDFPNDSGFSGTRRTLSSGPTVQNYSLNIRRKFSDSLSAYLDITYNENENISIRQPSFPSFVFLPATDPGNPFTDSILVTVPAAGIDQERRVESKALTASSGFIFDVSGQWSVVGDVTWGAHSLFDNVSGPDFGPSIFSAFGNGQIDPLSDLNAFPPDYSPFLEERVRSGQDSETELLNVMLKMSGAAFELSSGDAIVTLLAERRSQDFNGAKQTDINRTTGQSFIFLNPPASEEVVSVYGEISVPVFSGANARTGFQGLEFVASARYDDYSYDNVASGDDNLVFADQTTGQFPEIERRDVSFDGTGVTLGFKYTPIEDLIIRGSFATGFLPPSFSQTRPRLIENQSFRIIDPERGGVETIVGPIDRIVGGNPDLNPEESESYTLGLIATPSFLEGLRFSADYVRIEKTGEIANLGVNSLIRFFPDRFVRGPLEPDAPDGFTAGPILQVNDSAVNISDSIIEAVDFQLDYRLDTNRFGEFDFYAVASRQISFERQVSSDDIAVDPVGFFDGPIEWRANFGLDWRRNNWSAGWNVQYFDSFSVLSSDQAAALDPNSDAVTTRQFAEQELLFQGRDEVPSQQFHDAYIQYVFDSTNTEVRVGVNNIFNQYEVRADSAGFNSFYLPLDARLRTYSISLRQMF